MPTLNLDDLYRRYAPLVYRRVRRFVGPDEAEEVVHEVFLKVVEHAETFRSESSPVTWLYALTTRHCLNRLRDRGRRQELLDEFQTDIPCPRPAPPADAAVFLRQLWSVLPQELTVIGTYHYVDGLSHAEIGRLLGVSARTVGNRLAELRVRAQKAGGHAAFPLSSPEAPP